MNYVTLNLQVYLLVFENLKSILTLNHATMEAGYVNYQRTSKSADSVSMTAAFDAKGNLLVGIIIKMFLFMFYDHVLINNISSHQCQ